jgi:glycosyl transferase family 25
VQTFVISLPNAIERRKFQQDQLTKLGLEYKILDATSADDISEATFKKHYFDWQRPLRKTEIACYYSHRSAWEIVIKSRKPALILEDDAILSKCLPRLLDNLNDIDNSDLINLENRSRKKFVSRSKIDIDCNSKLLRLYQDRTGAAGYILWPSGAIKLLQHEKEFGISLADSHISSCKALTSFQVEPAAIIQLDQCDNYGIHNHQLGTIQVSTVSQNNNAKGPAIFWFKRIFSQIKLGIYILSLLIKARRRYIEISKENFSKK